MKHSNFENLAKLVRKWSLISTTEAGSGHPSSCLSAADLGTVLFDKYFTYDLKNPLNPNNDRLILSKGHAAPLLYTLFAMSGGLPFEKLKTLRKFGSPLDGHPMPTFKYSDAATGSLGQGLSIGAGLAYAAKNENRSYKTYVIMGDGELAEGSVWEAANFASYYKLNNLIAIVDINKFGQSQETMFGHHIEEYVSRFSAFGWEVIMINGHDFSEIDKALSFALLNKSDKPFVIIAKTHKGHGISFLQDKDGWHGKPLKKEDLDKALSELGDVDDTLRFELRKPKSQKLSVSKKSYQASVNFTKGDSIATREVYGAILTQLGNQDSRIYALDAEVKNSTFSIDFRKALPDRFIECFIAEQNMVGVAVGLSRIGKIPFVSTFAAFLTRAFDQIRMAAIGRANIKFVGSHAGVSIGEDGASQMGLEDIAMFGALPNTVIFHPSDAVSAAKVLPLMAAHNGISYLRTLRPKTPVIYDPSEDFMIGGSKVLRSSSKDIMTITACGITVSEALKAYDQLLEKGINVRVIDCYSIKPIDKKTLLKASEETKKKIIISVEDHFVHGGMGDFILEAVSREDVRVEKMAVDHISRSGKGEQLLDDAGISAKHIVNKVLALQKAR